MLKSKTGLNINDKIKVTVTKKGYVTVLINGKCAKFDVLPSSDSSTVIEFEVKQEVTEVVESN